MSHIRAGLLGVGHRGCQVMQALQTAEGVDLVAIADHEPSRLDALTETDAELFADCRSLIIESQLDALFLALPPAATAEFLRIAADRKLPSWMTAPAARNFAAAVELARLFKRADVPLWIARRWCHDEAFAAVHNPGDVIGCVYQARAAVATSAVDPTSWRGDRERAGGGVLLHAAYDAVDLLLGTMGRLDQVWALTTDAAPKRSAKPYDTEDAAALLLSFSDGAIGSINACACGGRQALSATFYGIEGTIELTADSLTLRDAAGDVTERTTAAFKNRYQASVEAFVSDLGDSQAEHLSAMAKHLPIMAAIDAAYLSARTGHPEQSSRFFEMADIEA